MEKINVLLISSNNKIIQIAENIIKSSDKVVFAIETAADLAAASARIKNGGINIVLLDLFLGALQGTEAVKKLKSEWNDTPIVVVVEKNNENYGIESIDDGADSYILVEELSANLLSNTLRYAMERRVLLVELEQYARELLTNEEYFKNLIASNVDGMVVVDRNNTVRFVNSSAEEFFHKSADFIVNKPFEYKIEKGKPQEITVTKDKGRKSVAEMRVVEIEWDREPALLASLRDITDRKNAEDEKMKLIRELQEAITKIKTLNGLLPICACCKKIRDDSGYWNQIEEYIQQHSSAEFSHGICPDCQKKLYSRVYESENKNE